MSESSASEEMEESSCRMGGNGADLKDVAGLGVANRAAKAACAGDSLDTADDDDDLELDCGELGVLGCGIDPVGSESSARSFFSWDIWDGGGPARVGTREPSDGYFGTVWRELGI